MRKIKPRHIILASFIPLFIIIVYFNNDNIAPIDNTVTVENKAPKQTIISAPTATAATTAMTQLAQPSTPAVNAPPSRQCDQQKLNDSLNGLIKEMTIAVKRYDNNHRQVTPVKDIERLIRGQASPANPLQLSAIPPKIVAGLYQQRDSIYDPEFIGHVASQNYALALALVRKRPFEQRAGYLALASVVNPDLPLSFIEQIQLDSPPLSIDDAIILTAYGYGESLLKHLPATALQNTQLAWQQNKAIMTLPILAIQSSNVSALKYWLDQGFTFTIDQYPLSPFEHIVPPIDEQSYQTALQLLHTLIQFDNHLTTTQLAQLNQWLQPKDATIVHDAVNIVSDDEVASQDQTKSSATPLADPNLMAIINAYKGRLNSLAYANPNCFVGQLEDASYLNTLTDWFIDDQDFIDKHIFALQKPNPYISRDIVATNQLMAKVQQQQWQEALALAQSDNDALNFLLELLLFKAAPDEVIQQTLQAGATLKPAQIFDLVLSRQSKQIPALIPFGLDVAYTSKDGMNALHLAAIMNSNLAMIKVLYHNGVVFKKDNRGYTPMDYVLKNDNSSQNTQRVLAFFKSQGHQA